MKKHSILKPLLISLIGVAAWFLQQWAYNNPQTIETAYSRGFYFDIQSIISPLTSWASFSIAEILFYAFLLFSAFFIVYILFSFKGKHKLHKLIQRTVVFASTLSVIFAVFTIFWGLNYARMPISHSMEFDTSEASVEELYSMTCELASNVNGFRAMVNEDEDGVFCLTSTKSAINENMGEIFAKNAPDFLQQCTVGNVKSPMASRGMSKLNITGIFFPFTFEPNVNDHQTDLLYASAACHEYAHFSGIAREDEANFVSYYTLSRCGDSELAYSGSMLALIHSMNKLYQADRDLYFDMRALLDDGVLRDLADHSAYWREFEGKAAEVHESINDTYLKSNNQSDGVKSYGRMVDLLIALYRKGEL